MTSPSTTHSAAPATELEPGVHIPSEHVDSDSGRLLGGHCEHCQLSAYPAPPRCPSCLGPLAARPLAAEGKLYSYAMIHAGPRGRRLPYTVGYVDLPDGTRLFAHVAADDDTHLRTDMPVRLSLHPDGSGYRAIWTPSWPSAPNKEVADA
ncbi:Zn-ribbon domain-containing OB-fold protein [Phytoactinopolyspora limicola]|uniref:Zn-ribbon domain-containing OB-fold protein n=1 Tax=Phytoactinopolyspora limicola TaxID=2715536 RepID=UPI001408944B|nr:OB-fold domain-containing protein [Phytoactinopolyspora limicola]